MERHKQQQQQQQQPKAPQVVVYRGYGEPVNAASMTAAELNAWKAQLAYDQALATLSYVGKPGDWLGLPDGASSCRASA